MNSKNEPGTPEFPAITGAWFDRSLESGGIRTVTFMFSDGTQHMYAVDDWSLNHPTRDITMRVNPASRICWPAGDGPVREAL